MSSCCANDSKTSEEGSSKGSLSSLGPDVSDLLFYFLHLFLVSPSFMVGNLGFQLRNLLGVFPALMKKEAVRCEESGCTKTAINSYLLAQSDLFFLSLLRFTHIVGALDSRRQ